MSIRIALTDPEIASCHPIMQELRPHIPEVQFVSRVRGLETKGYQLAYLEESDRVLSVAGFRISENLAWGRFLYVDDLVTLAGHRSRGNGARLISWLKEYAATQGCLQLHLDTGIQRQEAHRFYERAGLTKAGLHFFEDIAPDESLL